MTKQETKSGPPELTGSPKPAAAVVLNWVLVAYGEPDAQPGVVASRAQANRTLDGLKRRARFEAALTGARDPDVAQEAVSVILAGLAESNLLANFERARGTPRRYINRVLRRAVLRVVHERRRSVSGEPLPAGSAGREPTPAAAAEARDLERACARLLQDVPVPEAGGGAGSSSPTEYVRRHRARNARWAKVAHLFPNVPFRPAPRRAV